MSEGWISLHRKIQSHWIWQDKPFTKGQAWVDILLECNHSENKVLIKGQLIEVKRGESVNSLKTWSTRWGWSISKVRIFFDMLKNEKMITTGNEKITTRLIVCNYETYQTLQHAESTQKKRRKNAEKTQKNTNNNEINNAHNNEPNNDNNIDARIYRKFAHLSMTFEEFEKLNKNYTKEEIDYVLLKIENWGDNKKYKSLYLTSLVWLKREKDNKQTGQQRQYKTQLEIITERNKKLLEKYSNETH